jgi:hypothetical protein
MAYTDIDKPTDYFNTKLYTGDGTSPRSITGVGFQPDWVWTKNRSGTNGHVLYDSVRGVSVGELSTHNTNAEGLATQYGEMTSFDSDGYTFQDGETNGVVFNNSGNNYVSWNWLASNTTASNTDGSITSTVSANTTSGFSIVSYTGNATNGATVGHGLNSAPQMVITKNRGGSGDWQVLTNIYPNYSEGDYIYLSATDAKANSVNVSFLPTSTTWQMKSGQAGNVASTQIAYCFHSVKGFSKFGSYTGNGSTDGTFVYTGFKPAWFMTKRTDSANSWVMFDNKRSSSGGFNEIDYSVNANSNGAEETSSTSSDVDFCSNGIKITEDNGAINASGGTFIYMAFAENPFVTSGGIPACAR